MNQTQLYTLIGDLTNDPNHDRYTTSQIDTILDQVQDRWNVAAGILVDSTTLTTVAGTREYAITGLTGTPIAFRRVTHLGIDLQKRSKAYFDLYCGDDWSNDEGTPTSYYIDTDGDGFNIVLYPIPRDADAGANLVVEYVKRHTSLASASDEPFNSLAYVRPYHFGVAYEAAALLLTRDPDQANAVKIDRYQRVANNALADVTQVFKAWDKDEPLRLEGGRFWRY
jgi:hypothetical protein